MLLVNCNCSNCEQVAANRRQIRYTPKVEVVIPGRTNILFDGTVIYTKGSRAQINVALKNAFRNPVTVEGKLDMKSLFLFNMTVFDVHHRLGWF